ncbi:hypothetical protein EMIT0324P_10740 [Pseudomonas chlororaphis]
MALEKSRAPAKYRATTLLAVGGILKKLCLLYEQSDLRTLSFVLIQAVKWRLKNDRAYRALSLQSSGHTGCECELVK